MRFGIMVLIVFGFLQNLFGFQNLKIDTLGIDTSIVYDEFVITAHRQLSHKNDRPEAISILGEKALTKDAPMSLTHAISQMPGVWMQKTNHGGGSPYLRGLTGYQTLILIDGIRFNNSTFRSGPNQYLNTIDPHTLERIEIIRGQGSVQYGSDAIGGIINLITQKPQFHDKESKLTSNLFVKKMSKEMEFSGRAEMEFANQNMWFFGGMSAKKLGNIRAGGDIGALIPTGYNEISSDIKTAFLIKNNSLITFGLQYLKQSDVPLYHKIVTGEFYKYQFDPQQRMLFYSRLETFFKSRFLDKINWTFSYQKSMETRLKQKTAQADTYRDNDEVKTFGANMEILSKNSTFWKISSGLEFYYDKVGSNTIITDAFSNQQTMARGLYPNDSKYTSLAIYSLHSFQFNRLTATAGLRYNSVQLTIEDELFGLSRVGPKALIGNLGLNIKMNQNIRFVASSSTSFRSPNINDVSSFGIADFRYEVPNYNLKPEKSINLEIGFKTQFENADIAMHGYVIKLKDLISNTPSFFNGKDTIDGLQVYKRVNANKAILRGFELEGNIKLTEKVSTSGFIIYTYGQNKSENGPMRRIPPLNGRISLLYKLNTSFQIKTDWIFSGSQSRLSKGDINDNRISIGGTPEWHVIDLLASYQIKNYTINLGIQNIFNEKYRIHGSGVDGLGRSLWISIQGSIF